MDRILLAARFTQATAQRHWLRNFLMHGFHLLVMMVVGGSIRDTQCGFKVRHAAVDRLDTQCRVEVRHAAVDRLDTQCGVKVRHAAIMDRLDTQCGVKVRHAERGQTGPHRRLLTVYLITRQARARLPHASLKPTGCSWSYLACRIGHLSRIGQPCIGSSFQ
jgi:hypothetical protein